LAGSDILEASHSDVEEYLAAINTQCPYPNNTYACGGKPKIKHYLVHATNQWSEFLGYDKWKQNERGHLSLQIKAGVDIDLLKSLFAYEGRILNQEVCIFNTLLL
jgi:hypothetical protein